MLMHQVWGRVSSSLLLSPFCFSLDRQAPAPIKPRLGGLFIGYFVVSGNDGPEMNLVSFLSSEASSSARKGAYSGNWDNCREQPIKGRMHIGPRSRFIRRCIVANCGFI